MANYKLERIINIFGEKFRHQLTKLVIDTIDLIPDEHKEDDIFLLYAQVISRVLLHQAVIATKGCTLVSFTMSDEYQIN
jgi:hypothetical protein